ARRARASAVAAGQVSGFHRGHHAVRDTALRFDERFDRCRHHIARSQNVALNRIEDFRSRDLPLDILGYKAVPRAGVASHPSLQIEDSILPALETGVLTQEFDDSLGVGSFLELFENQSLVLMCSV